MFHISKGEGLLLLCEYSWFTLQSRRKHDLDVLQHVRNTSAAFDIQSSECHTVQMTHLANAGTRVNGSTKKAFYTVVCVVYIPFYI